MLALHLHPALRSSALPHFEQRGLLNKHKLTSTTNASKAQLSKAGSHCGFAAVSLLRVRKRERKGNAAGMCPEELYLTPPWGFSKSRQFKAKSTALLSALSSWLCCTRQGIGRFLQVLLRSPMPSYYILEATVGPCKCLHPWRKAAGFSLHNFDLQLFIFHIRLFNLHHPYIGLQIQKMCSLP